MTLCIEQYLDLMGVVKDKNQILLASDKDLFFIMYFQVGYEEKNYI